MKILAIAALTAALFTAACTDRDGATRTLETAGYTNIRITGYSWFSCGEDDTYATGFTAIGVNGRPVQGVVCSGFLFKGNTIRTF